MKRSLLTDSNAVLVKKYRLSFGVSTLLGLAMAAAAIILSRVAASTVFSFGDTAPEFFYNNHSGIMVLYTRVFIIIFALLTVIFPQYLLLKELHNNNWYMYSKMGYSGSQLLLNRYLLVYPRVIRTYVIGFAAAFIASLVMLGTSGINYIQIVLLLALGILFQTVNVGFLFMVSSVFRPGYAVSIAALIACTAWYAVLNSSGLFDAASEAELDTVFSRLYSVGISGVIIVPVLILVLSVAVTFSVAGRKSSEYNTEELGAEQLVDLEITEDMLILEKGSGSYKVAISGPVINGKEDHLEIPKID